MLPNHACCSCFARRNSVPLSPIFVPRLQTQKEHEIGAIDLEISRTEDAIVRLVKQRAILKRKRNAYSVAVNLPPELLILVFEYACLPSHTNQNALEMGLDYQLIPGSIHLGLSIGPGAVTPFLLGAVCTSWRHVSQNAPQLWTNIIIRMRNRYPDAQAELLRRWLSYTRMKALSIQLFEEDTEDDDIDEWGLTAHGTEVIDVLGEHAQQWQTVDMYLPAAWKRSLSRAVRSLPLLTCLTLRLTENTPSMGHVSIFTSSPALREVTLVGYGTGDVELPWAQLTRLEAECFSAYDVYDTLRRSTALRQCQFEELYRGMVPFTPVPFTHTALDTLELVVDSVVGLGTLLDSLTLPCLRNLVLALPDDSNTSAMQWLLPLIQRSACPLLKLHIVGVTPLEDELVECLRAVPTLTTLLLLNPRPETGGKITEWLFRLMSSGGIAWDTARRSSGEQEDIFPGRRASYLEWQNHIDDAVPLVPRLEKLVYQGPLTFDSHALVQFLLGRWYSHLSCLGPPPEVPKAGQIGQAICKDDSSALGDEGQDLYQHIDPLGLAHASSTARLRSAIFTTPMQIRFEGAEEAHIQTLVADGMHLQFLVDPNADT